MMEKHTIKAPSKHKYHRDGTLSKAEVMVIHICQSRTCERRSPSLHFILFIFVYLEIMLIFAAEI